MRRAGRTERATPLPPPTARVRRAAHTPGRVSVYLCRDRLPSCRLGKGATRDYMCTSMASERGYMTGGNFQRRMSGHGVVRLSTRLCCCSSSCFACFGAALLLCLRAQLELRFAPRLPTHLGIHDRRCCNVSLRRGILAFAGTERGHLHGGWRELVPLEERSRQLIPDTRFRFIATCTVTMRTHGRVSRATVWRSA